MRLARPKQTVNSGSSPKDFLKSKPRKKRLKGLIEASDEASAVREEGYQHNKSPNEPKRNRKRQRQDKENNIA
jgi:hypothetical protein